VETMSFEREVDVLCVGSGAGGMSAAITAAEAGLRTLVVEKDDKAGGVQALSSGQIWLGATHLQSRLGIGEPRAEFAGYLDRLSQGLALPAMRDMFIDRGNEALRFLDERIGIPFMIVRGLPDYFYPRVCGSRAEGRYIEVEPFAGRMLGDWAAKCGCSPYGAGYSYTTSSEWVAMQVSNGRFIGDCLRDHLAADERCAGAGPAAWLPKDALERGVEVLLESPATELTYRDGRVTGAIIATPRGAVRVRARRGVVLATSGYDWNPDLVRAFEALPEAGSMCPPTVEGDHLKLAAAAGVIAIAARAPAQTPIFVGYRVPSETVHGRLSHRMLLPGHPHSMIVNAQGKRFCDDGFYPDVAVKVARFDGVAAGMPNWPAWLIFDDDFRIKYGLLPAYPGQPLPTGVADEAADLDALSQCAGLDSDGLRATVARFNEFAAAGVDLDFGRGTVPWGRIMTGDPRRTANWNLGPIERPPFYAVKLERVVMGVPTAGLPIDTHARVRDARGAPVPGLYAAGNSAAWTDIGGGYNSGIANMRGLLQGYVAARHMAAAENASGSGRAD
jgi:3-oxosteroid 1-dehydrogenase